MAQYYGLSKTEYLIMEIIWEFKHPLSFSEIMDYFSKEEKKKWKKQTLHTYLTRLIKKGVLSSSGNRNKNLYQPALSKDVYIQQWTKNFINESFDGSLNKFMLAFTGNQKELSPKELEELRSFLNE